MKYVLDMFCGAGGAADGIARAGFHPEGVDNVPQKNYPYPFRCVDALGWLEWLIATGNIDRYAWIWASVPCQLHSSASGPARKNGSVYPDLMAQTRRLLKKSELPYIIENVPNAPFCGAVVELSGGMFDLMVIRKRRFESDIFLTQPDKIDYSDWIEGVDFVQVLGNGRSKGDNAQLRCSAMGICRELTLKEVNQAIPPAYAEYLAAQMK